MDHLRHPKYKSKHTEMEYLDNIRKNRKVKEIEIIKVKIIKLIIKIMKNFLEFEIDVGELKDREIKIRNERK